jgi:hypothetical protein
LRTVGEKTGRIQQLVKRFYCTPGKSSGGLERGRMGKLFYINFQQPVIVNLQACRKTEVAGLSCRGEKTLLLTLKHVETF